MEALAIPSVLMATMPWTLVGWYMANLSMMLAPAPVRGQKYLTRPWSHTYRLRGRSPASPSDCRGRWRGWARCPPWWGRCSPWEGPPPPVPGPGEPRAGIEISCGPPPCGRRPRTPARSWRRPPPCGGSGRPRRRGASPGPPGKDFNILISRRGLRLIDLTELSESFVLCWNVESDNLSCNLFRLDANSHQLRLNICRYLIFYSKRNISCTLDELLYLDEDSHGSQHVHVDDVRTEAGGHYWLLCLQHFLWSQHTNTTIDNK